MGYAKDSLEGRFLSGEVDAQAIVVRWIAQILALPRFRMVRPDWADLHQEALRRVVESLRRDRFDSALEFRSYVQAITRYTARDALQLRIRSARYETSEPVDLDAALSDQERRPDTSEITTMITGMAQGCRDVLRMVFFEELAYSEIARRLAVPEGTVKSRVFRCLKKARELLVGSPQGS